SSDLDKFRDQHRQYSCRSEDCVVFAMLAVKIPGKRRRVFFFSTEAGKQERYSPSVISKFRKARAQEGFFAAHHGHVDDQENSNRSGGDPEVARGYAKSHGHDQRSQIKRI